MPSSTVLLANTMTIMKPLTVAPYGIYNQCQLKSYTGYMYLLSEGKRVAVAYHNLPDLQEEQKMKLVIRCSLESSSHSSLRETVS